MALIDRASPEEREFLRHCNVLMTQAAKAVSAREKKQRGQRPGFLTAADAAKMLGMSAAWLKRSRHDGTGPNFYKANRTVLYRIDDICAFIEANMVAPYEHGSMQEVRGIGGRMACQRLRAMKSEPHNQTIVPPRSPLWMDLLAKDMSGVA